MFKNILTQFKYHPIQMRNWIGYISVFFNPAQLDLLNNKVILIFSKDFL